MQPKHRHNSHTPLRLSTELEVWEQGDEQENWVGARFAASMPMCATEGNMQTFTVNKKLDYPSSQLEGVTIPLMTGVRIFLGVARNKFWRLRIIASRSLAWCSGDLLNDGGIL